MDVRKGLRNQLEKVDLRLFVGDKVNRITAEIKMSLAECYKKVFNASAFEDNFSLQEALERVEGGLALTEWRAPLCSLLIKKGEEKVVGFAWGQLIYPEFLDLEDMPFYLSLEEKEKGLVAVRKEFRNKEKIFLFQEFGASREFRGGISVFLVKALFESLNDLGIKRLLYWTSKKSPAFWLGGSLRWEPFFNFKETSYWLLEGRVPYSSKLMRGGIKGGIQGMICFAEASLNKRKLRKKFRD